MYLSRAGMEISNDSALLNEFLTLDQFGKVQAEYIWIGGNGLDLRGKTKVCVRPYEWAEEIKSFSNERGSINFLL
jgi:glutamine synthetase